MILPTPSKPTIDPTQLLNAYVVQWDLVWPEGVEADPQDILQSVERSQFPQGPWETVGSKIPGTITQFTDLTVTAPEAMFQRTYYRVVVQRVKR